MKTPSISSGRAETKPVRIVDDGHDETRVRRGGDPDIVVLLVDQLVGALIDRAR